MRAPFVPALTTLCLGLPAQQPAQQDPVDFNRHVRPILSDRCFTCHGPDAEQRQADLRLDDRVSATADRGGYAVNDEACPERAVAYEEDFLRGLIAASGLRVRQLFYGHQDVLLLEHRRL